MTSTIVTLTLVFAASATGQGYYAPKAPHSPNQHPLLAPGGRILAPGPGLGYGFRNGNPDKAGKASSRRSCSRGKGAWGLDVRELKGGKVKKGGGNDIK